MDILIFIFSAIVAISSVFIYLYLRAFKTSDKSLDQKMDLLSMDSGPEPRKSKSKDSKSKVKQASKPVIKPSMVEQPVKREQVAKKVKIAVPSKKEKSKPVVEKKEPALDYIDFEDSDELPVTDWIPVEPKRKPKSAATLKKSAVEPETIAAPVLIIPPTSQPQQPQQQQHEEKPINKTQAHEVKTAPQKITMADTIKLERDCLRTQVDLLQTELSELTQKQTKQSELQQKLNEAQKEIELLKSKRPVTAAPAIPVSTDPVILDALQAEISHLVKDLTLAKQKNESMQARLDYAEKKLHEKEQKAAEPVAADKTVVEELQKRVEASDHVAKQNYVHMENYRVELEKLKSVAAELEAENKRLRPEKELMEKRMKELESKAKTQLEHHEKSEAKIRDLMEAELKKLKEQLASMKVDASREQMINGSCNLADFQGALLQLAKVSSKPEDLKKLLPRMEKIVSGLELDTAPHHGTQKNGVGGPENGHAAPPAANGVVAVSKTTRSRIASKDQLIDLCLENKHYKELLHQTETNLSVLQNLVDREQAVWKKELSDAKSLNSQLVEKVSKLEQQLLQMRQQDTTNS